MDGERKVNISEGVPLNSPGAANIYLNTGKNTKVNSSNGTVIHLKTEKSSPSDDVGLHIKTTFSIASSKKVKLLFILNFLLSAICMIICCSVAFYFWNEMSTMRRQLDAIKEQLIIQNLRGSDMNQDKIKAGALVSFQRPQPVVVEREPRMDVAKDDISPNARRYYVNDFGEDMVFVDSSKKISNKVPVQRPELEIVTQKEMLVAHFNGAISEVNLGSNAMISPWRRDTEVSSKNSEEKIELTNYEYVTIRESGLYLVYAQVVYLGHAPNCYFIWATHHQTQDKPRLLTSCATGDDSSPRPLKKSQISCSAQTVARLNEGDVVNLAQREFNRTLWLRPGYTYFGFVKLSS